MPTHTQEGLGKEKQDAYLFSYLVQKEGKELRELLAKKPQFFKKKLEEIEKTSQAVSQHWTKKDIIQTINQIPQEKEWQLPTCYQKQDLGALLLKYKEAGGKNKLVLDFDHYKKDETGNFLVNEEQRKEIDTVITLQKLNFRFWLLFELLGNYSLVKTRQRFFCKVILITWLTIESCLDMKSVSREQESCIWILMNCLWKVSYGGS